MGMQVAELPIHIVRAVNSWRKLTVRLELSLFALSSDAEL